MTDVDVSSYPKFGQSPSLLNQAAGWTSLATAQQQLAATMHDRLTNELAAAASDPNITPDEVVRRGQRLVKEGVISPNIYSQMVTTLPTPQQMQSDPLALKKVLDAHLQRQQSAQQNYLTRYPNIQGVNNGAGQGFVTVDPRTNSVNQTGGNASYIPTQLSPETLAKPETVGVQPPGSPNAGAPIVGTAAQRLQQVSPSQLPSGTLLPPQAAPNPLTSARPAPRPVAAPVAAPNRLAPAPAPSPTPAAPQGAPSALQPAYSAPVPTPSQNIKTPYGALQTPGVTGIPAPGSGPQSYSLAPGVAEAQATGLGKIAGASGDLAANMQQLAETSDQRLASLKTLETLLPKFTSGPQAEKILNAKGSWNTIADIAGLPENLRFNRENISAQEGFRKIAQQIADAQAPGLTDAARAGSKVANPSTSISNLGNAEIIPMLKGQEDYIRLKNAKLQQFLASDPGNASKVAEFSQKFRENTDPRVFQIQYMTPQQQDDYMKKLTPTDRSALIVAVKKAHDAGLVK